MCKKQDEFAPGILYFWGLTGKDDHGSSATSASGRRGRFLAFAIMSQKSKKSKKSTVMKSSKKSGDNSSPRKQFVAPEIKANRMAELSSESTVRVRVHPRRLP